MVPRVRTVLLLACLVAFALPSPASEAKRKRKRKGKAKAGKMVKVPAGKYTVHIAGPDTPQTHVVQVRAFAIDRTEVTVADYRKCVLSAKCSEPKEGTYFSLAQRRQDFKDFCNWPHKGREDHPINCIDRQQAAEYCAYRGKRLPTSDQWEAAVYGSPDAKRRHKYAFGKAIPDKAELCWGRKDSRQGTCPVTGSADDVTWKKLAGASANVSEWTRSEVCAGGGDKCRNKSAVLRGGNWYNDYAVKVGVARVRLISPKGYDHTLGFRCVSK